MKKYIILTMLLSFTFNFAQDSTHVIFNYWDMDKWNNYNVNPGPSGYWHDMDFVCYLDDPYKDYYWKLVLVNSSQLEISTIRLKIKTVSKVTPNWNIPSETGTDNSDHPHVLRLPFGYEPTYFKVYFYENASSDHDENLTIGDDFDGIQSIDRYNKHLLDLYHYYQSKILSFSGSVDLQTGNIDLLTKILQPEKFNLTVLVNNTPYPAIQNEYFEFSGNDWEREKTIDYLNIDSAWLVDNWLTGSLTIKLIIDSHMWGETHTDTIVSSGYRTTIVDSPIPSTPTISVSGVYGDNPVLTFSGGGNNVDHYILKKEYVFNSGGNPIHYINLATSQYTDQNVVIERFGGDVTAHYSVKVVGPTGIESQSSNIVSKDGQSQWKKAVESEEDKESKEYSLEENYPNPFNPSTEISYQIKNNSFVNLVVYNSLGQEVAELVNQHQSSGEYSVKFNASNLPSGIYIYKITAGEFSSVKKMMLTK